MVRQTKLKPVEVAKPEEPEKKEEEETPVEE